MSERLHNRQEFYKYATCATALRIIETRSLRWSAPTLFNDPFDHQTGFVMDMDLEQFAKLLTDSSERLVFGNAVPLANPPSLNTRMILKMRSIRHRLPRDAFLKDIHEGSLEIAQRMEQNLQEFNSWIRGHLCDSRVLCVTEVPDNVVMWSHYADEHRGVVFKLRCDDQLPNRLLAARKVEYTDKFLSFPSAEAYAKHLTGEVPVDLVPLIEKIAFTKHKDWSYETEWRVHLPLLGRSAGEGFAIFKEDPRIFDAAYVGCRMATREIDAIKTALSAHMPATKLFRAKLSNRSFSLAFEALGEI